MPQTWVEILTRLGIWVTPFSYTKFDIWGWFFNIFHKNEANFDVVIFHQDMITKRQKFYKNWLILVNIWPKPK